MSEEEKLREEYAAAGVELDEIEKGEEKSEIPAPTEEKPKEDVPEEKPKEEEKEHLQEEPTKPRSIYEEYKEKKEEVKAERELREKAEAERDELQQKLAALQNADTLSEKKEASEDLVKFAQEIGADPKVIAQMRDLFLKDVKTNADEQLLKDLAEFKAFKQENSKVIEEQRFNAEFESVLPAIKEFAANASDDEMKEIRKRVDTIAHTEGWHDKSLDYIVFKHKEELSELVSPKRRGMESKEKKDVVEISNDFNPNPDFSKMTPQQIEAWEKLYREAGKTDGLVIDSQGRKTFV